MVAASGLCISGLGLYLITKKVFAYQSLNYRAVMFSPAAIATGLLIAALAFLPARIVERLFGIKKRQDLNIHPHYQRHHHDSSTQL